MQERPLLSGGILINQLKVCVEHFGQPIVDEALLRLGDAERQQLRNMLPVSWVRTELAEATVNVIAERVGRDPDALFREVVTTTVERQFRTVWRAILHFTTDSALVSRTPIIYSKTYNGGSMTSEIPSPGIANIRVTGWPSHHDRQMLGLSYGIGTVLRLAGRKHVDVVHTVRSGGADFIGTWKP